MSETNNLDEIISEIDKDESCSDVEDSNSEEGDDQTDKLDKVQVTKEFQENVVKYVKLDDLIRKKQQELSELKERRKPSEEYILKYLDSVDENIIEITDGKLRKNKSETKASLNQDIIKNAISETITDPAIVEEIMKKMETKRPLNTHVNLKRTTKRQVKKKVKSKK